MSLMPPVADVKRLVAAEEFPASVREIRADLDPRLEGVLMEHQSDWIKLCAGEDLTIAEKGRRTGITFATALDVAITAASQKSAGGDNVYYIGDTKEKGLEFIGYCAHMAKVMAAGADEMSHSGVEMVLFEDYDKVKDQTRYITAYRIRFATGFQIMALSSRPENIRGLQGIVIIDEAAFHNNVQAVIDAALALLIWGGKIRIISTHNGTQNAFNQLIKDARAGENAFKVFYCDFDMAVENGIYERVCFMKEREATVEGKEEWYNKIRKSYGSNKAAMREELDCIPRDGSGVAIPTVLIERAMREERPVLRLSFDKEWALKSKEYRKSFAEDWIRVHVQPLLDKLDPAVEHSFGSDYARHRDFAQFAPIAVPNNLSRYVPFVIEMHNVPTRQQEQVIWHCIEHLPRFRAGAMDASGNGATLAEYTADEFGHDRIIQVMLNDAWYRANMRVFQDAFTDDTFDIPKDGNLRNDLRALEVIDGIIKLPKLTKKDLKEPEKKRHGDFAIALALGYIATLHDVAPCEFFVGGQHRDLGLFKPDHGSTSDLTSILETGMDWSGFND